MKRIFKQTLIFASLALVAGGAAAQISGTKHNLSTSGTGTNHLTAGTEQICVFCHTPHASNTSVSAPLWNKGLPATTYTTYSTANSSTIDGEVLTVGSVSAACLSCHDGTQAMDNMVNAPGSGGFTAAGASPVGYTWAGSSTITGVANLTGDLTNDHPIGIEYCGGGLSNGGTTTLSGSCKDADFKAPITNVINSVPVFWVDANANTTRDKADIILYSRTFAAGANRPSVECASCHDPHVASKGSDNISFMRVTTAASAVCLACHTK